MFLKNFDLQPPPLDGYENPTKAFLFFPLFLHYTNLPNIASSPRSQPIQNRSTRFFKACVWFFFFILLIVFSPFGDVWLVQGWGRLRFFMGLASRIFVVSKDLGLCISRCLGLGLRKKVFLGLKGFLYLWQALD